MADARYIIRSTNPETGLSTIVSGGPWTAEEVTRKARELDADERHGDVRLPLLKFTIETEKEIE